MPKKKGGKKGAKIVDGIATSEMSREQLVGHVRRIQVELDREREERNFFMLEREKLFALWNIAMEQLNAHKVKSRLAVEQMTEHDDEKQMELLMCKQKLRFLLTDQSKRVDEARLLNLKKLQKAQDEMIAIQKTLKYSVDQKSKEVRQSQNAIHELLRQMKLENAKNISEVKNETALEIARMERDFARLNLDRERRDEIAIENEREIVKNMHLEHIENLKSIHEEAMAKTTDHFHQLLLNNLATVAALQDEIKEMKENEKQMAQHLKRCANELDKLEEHARQEKKERKHVSTKESKINKDIQRELRKMNQAQQTKDKYARSMEVANEALVQKMATMGDEYKAFKQTLTKAILDMQQEACMKSMILDLKLKAASQQNQKLVPKDNFNDDKETKTYQK